ncbi:hypothetical protein QVA93_11415 [Clostridioides difficile]|nr:hypothetical protein [Clostridioides difficile]
MNVESIINVSEEEKINLNLNLLKKATELVNTIDVGQKKDILNASLDYINHIFDVLTALGLEADIYEIMEMENNKAEEEFKQL